MKWALMVHGGAKKIPEGQLQSHEQGCLAALQVGVQILTGGGSALDAVEACIRGLEDDPIFNAGTGSALNLDGEIETDAALMDGAHLGVGAVAALKGFRNPIAVARKVLESGKAVLVVGNGAASLAREGGLAEVDPTSLITAEARDAWEQSKQSAGGEAAQAKDTVGCVALDCQGRLAAGTSTGGLENKLPGRVGDSPLPGCGLLATSRAAVSLTGDGESIIRVTLASRILALIEQGRTPQEAAEQSIIEMRVAVPGEAGCIVVDQEGRIGIAHSSEHLACAFLTSEMESPIALTSKVALE